MKGPMPKTNKRLVGGTIGPMTKLYGHHSTGSPVAVIIDLATQLNGYRPASVMDMHFVVPKITKLLRR